MMDWFIEILKLPILPAAVVVVGLLLLKKPFSGVLSGAIKTMIGFMLLVFGAQIVMWSVSPLTDIIWNGFGTQSVLLNSEFMGAALIADYGFEGFCVMFIAIVVNLLLARYTKANGIYLTGHHLLYSSLLITVILGTLTPLPPWAVIVTGGALVGVYACLTVKATQPLLHRVTGSGDIGFANSGNTGVLLGSLLGKLFQGKKKFEKGQKSRFEMKDVVVLSTVVMFFYYLLFSIAAGKTQGNWGLDCLLYAVGFGAAVSVVFLGMRMLLAEIIQIMYALQARFAPKAVKGLDASAVISYCPAAWMWGFLLSFAAGIAVMLIALLAGARCVVLPGVASCFFTGGSSAVFANAYGGKRGVVISSVAVGLVISLSIMWMTSSVQALDGYGVAFGETEYGVWGGLAAWFVRLFAGA